MMESRVQTILQNLNGVSYREWIVIRNEIERQYAKKAVKNTFNADEGVLQNIMLEITR